MIYRLFKSNQIVTSITFLCLQIPSQTVLGIFLNFVGRQRRNLIATFRNIATYIYSIYKRKHNGKSFKTQKKNFYYVFFNGITRTQKSNVCQNETPSGGSISIRSSHIVICGNKQTASWWLWAFLLIWFKLNLIKYNKKHGGNKQNYKQTNLFCITE
jgi:hypothetical protein